MYRTDKNQRGTRSSSYINYRRLAELLISRVRYDQIRVAVKTYRMIDLQELGWQPWTNC
uniref:Uncharacterized protein n=1 Tax=Anguilla anguilla TaxID=7936 RepID=A0A0E9PH89_ANGAN